MKTKQLITSLLFLLSIGWGAKAQTWSTVGGGLSSAVIYSSAVYNGELYLGGDIANTPAHPTNGILKWNDTTYSLVGGGVNGTVNALAEYNGDLYAAGYFYSADTSITNSIAKWDGTNWSAVTGLAWGATIQALSVYNGELYVGGNITIAGGSPGNAIARWNGLTWSNVGAGLKGTFGPGEVLTFEVDTINNLLYVGGVFDTAGSTPAKNIAKWNGTSWSGLGSGVSLNSACWAISMYAGNLYAQDSSGVSEWSGSLWTSIGASDMFVSALTEYNGELYAGGVFTTMDGSPANNVAIWDGAIWSAAGAGADVWIITLTEYNGWLYAAGDSTTGNNRVFRWNSLSAGIKEDELNPDFTVFPNPSKGKFSLTSEKGISKIEIINMLGEKVYSLFNIQDQTSKEIELSNLPDGVYFLKINDEKSSLSKKIVIQ